MTTLAATSWPRVRSRRHEEATPLHVTSPQRGAQLDCARYQTAYRTASSLAMFFEVVVVSYKPEDKVWESALPSRLKPLAAVMARLCNEDGTGNWYSEAHIAWFLSDDPLPSATPSME